MTIPTELPVRDAITGATASVWPHRHWVLLGHGDGEDLWLTPTAARRLAADLAAAAATAETHKGGPRMTSTLFTAGATAWLLTTGWWLIR